MIVSAFKILNAESTSFFQKNQLELFNAKFH
jgi:hypothetical protein